jgi:predicted ATPase
VQAVIEARLGQLGASARGLVDLAATIGREFTTDVLAGAGELDEDELLGDLDELWRRRIVREWAPTPTTSATTGSGRSPTGR